MRRVSDPRWGFHAFPWLHPAGHWWRRVLDHGATSRKDGGTSPCWHSLRYSFATFIPAILDSSMCAYLFLPAHGPAVVTKGSSRHPPGTCLEVLSRASFRTVAVGRQNDSGVTDLVHSRAFHQEKARQVSRGGNGSHRVVGCSSLSMQDGSIVVRS